MPKPHITANHMRKMLAVNAKLRSMPGMYTPYGDGAGGLSRSWVDFGFPKILDFHFYYLMYRRVGLGRAVVNLETDLCWLNRPVLKRGDDEDETLKKFARRVRLWGMLKQLDQFQHVGHYAGAIIRVADDKELREPLDPKSINLDDIESITPAWESQLIVGNIDSDPKSPRYGLPVDYLYNQRGNLKPQQRDGGEAVIVHHSRVWIMNEGAAGNTIYGTSALEAPYNSIVSWANIVGSGGEGLKRQASARLVLQQLAKAGETYEPPAEPDLDNLLDMLQDQQEDPFSAVPYLGGMELKSIQADLSNPEHFATVALQDVAAACGYSSNGLIGAQVGQLAGDQNGNSDKQRAQSRCDNYLTDFVYDILGWIEDKCRDFTVGNVEIEFPDLLAPGDKDKLENAAIMAKVNQAMVVSGELPFSSSDIRLAAGYEAEEDLMDVEPPEPPDPAEGDDH